MVENINHHYCVDASFVIAYLLNESNDHVNKMFQLFLNKKINFVSSELLNFEVGNTLLFTKQEMKIDSLSREETLLDFLDLDIALIKLNWISTYQLAKNHKLTYYDCSYLAISQSLNCPLLTLDRKLQLAATKSN